MNKEELRVVNEKIEKLDFLSGIIDRMDDGRGIVYKAGLISVYTDCGSIGESIDCDEEDNRVLRDYSKDIVDNLNMMLKGLIKNEIDSLAKEIRKSVPDF